MARHRSKIAFVTVATIALALLGTAVLAATDIGRVKTAQGSVRIQRGGQPVAAAVGTKVQQGDTIVTGADGAAGIVFSDDSRLAVGPNTTLVIDTFVFDPTTHQGKFQASLRQGTLSAVSGKLARQSGDAMSVHTPVAVMAVRGTHVLVRVSEGRP